MFTQQQGATLFQNQPTPTPQPSNFFGNPQAAQPINQFNNPTTPMFPSQTPQPNFQPQPQMNIFNQNPMNQANQPRNFMSPGMPNPSQYGNNFAMPQYQQGFPPTSSMSILHQPQSLNLTPLNQQNFSWKINQKSDAFSLNISNTLRDKEVQSLNPQMRARITQYEKELEDNRKYLKNSNENQNNIQEISQKLKKDLHNLANNSILLRNSLKREKIIFDELKNEINVNSIIVNDFLQYYELFKKGKLQSIQVPSTFLSIAVEKLLKTMKTLKAKLEEIIDLAKTHLIIQEKTEFNDDYEFFIHLIGELYQYFIFVAHLVMKFDETYVDFRTEALEHYKSYGYTDLEKHLEHESKKLYKDEMIENLMKIINKLEENKKIEREQERVIKF